MCRTASAVNAAPSNSSDGAAPTRARAASSSRCANGSGGSDANKRALLRQVAPGNVASACASVTGWNPPKPNHGCGACEAPALRSATKFAADGTCAIVISRISHGAPARSVESAGAVSNNANGSDSSAPVGATTSDFTPRSRAATGASVSA